jgi:hypothetical protein
MFKTTNMKKTLAIALAFGVATAFAQDLTSKKGEKILPEAGDWSIGFDALPMIGTVGNLMNLNTNTTVTGTGGATNYIMGKYFKDEKTAFRGMLGLNLGSTTVKSFEDQVGSTSTPPAQVENSVKTSGNSVTLGGGYEMRKGSTRLQGYYGGMAMITLGGSKITNTYGNALSANNPVPTRTLTNKAGSTFGFNLNGFIGAEYFVLPKISIGAEYWWGLGFSRVGEGEQTTEGWNGTGITSTTTKTAGSSSFGLGGRYASGQMFVNLHF